MSSDEVTGVLSVFLRVVITALLGKKIKAEGRRQFAVQPRRFRDDPRLTQTRLLFIVEALKELLGDESFVNLLRAEGLASMPKPLSVRISGEKND